MFPGGTPDMSQLLQQAQQMQEQLMAAQQELADAEVKGTAGGGVVTATVNGVGELRSLDIKREVVDPDDVETLADLVVAAVHDATANAQALQARKLGPMASMLGGGGLPGGGLGGGLPGGGGQSGGGPSGGGLPGLPG